MEQVTILNGNNMFRPVEPMAGTEEPMAGTEDDGFPLEELEEASHNYLGSFDEHELCYHVNSYEENVNN